MLPSRCSITQDGRQCPNPPEFIVTITSSNGDEYMLGVTCASHRHGTLEAAGRLQDSGRVAKGRIGFTPVKPVGTDCIRGDPDELVQIGGHPEAGKERSAGTRCP